MTSDYCRKKLVCGVQVLEAPCRRPLDTLKDDPSGGDIFVLEPPDCKYVTKWAEVTRLGINRSYARGMRARPLRA